MGPRVVIVGASLAGLRSAEAVLAALPDAQVTLVGDEPHAPYNRPPLSKDVLAALVAGEAGRERIALRHRLGPDAVSWRLGTAAVGVEAAARRLRLADGSELAFDWLIAASGLRPRRLDLPQGATRHVLRGWDDAVRLAQALRPGARLVVIGAGFIGAELAATASALGHPVTLIEPQPQPMRAALGPEVAAALAAFHRARGIDLRCGLAVTGAEEGAITLSDGSRVAGEVIVEAVGSIPNVDWLEGCGADLTNGVLCDGTLAAAGPAGAWLLAVGDVARFPNALFDACPRRVEHWSIAGLTARQAALTIAARQAGQGAPARFAALPSFWSDQHGLRLQAFGAPFLADAAEVVAGRLDRLGEGPCLVDYRRDGRLVGTLGLGAPPALLAGARSRLEGDLNDNLAA